MSVKTRNSIHLLARISTEQEKKKVLVIKFLMSNHN